MSLNPPKIEDYLLSRHPIECQTFGGITNRDYQQAAFDLTVEHLRSTDEPGVVVASVGAGKTIMIAALCKHVSSKNGRVLVLSRQGEIIKQDAEDIILAECNNSIFSASLGMKSAVWPVICGTEGTVCRALEQDLLYMAGEKPSPSKLFNYSCDLILIDEVHMVDYDNPDCQYMKIIKEMKRRNPKLRIIGYTGTPYRGVEPMLPRVGESTKQYFFKHKIIDISQEYLTKRGFLSPCSFGFSHDEVGYELEQFKSDGNDGIQEFTKAELKKQESEILKNKSTTQKIVREVVEKTKNRNVVMITGAGKKHLKEIASELPDGSYVIITDDTGAKKRMAMLDECKAGRVKFLLQVGCLTTGLNIPIIDTIVILRKIGSLTLLVQLIGRGLRTLKQSHINAGYTKSDCLVLDYSDTMRELGGLYENPILEAAEKEHGKQDGKMIPCPKCGEMNSFYARRCIGETAGQRCDFFFKSRVCETKYKPDGTLIQRGCGTENDIAARECRQCGRTLIDPNEKLKNTHYTKGDELEVINFSMRQTRNDGLMTEYTLQNGRVVSEFFKNPKKGGRNAAIFKAKVIVPHALADKALYSRYKSCKNIHDIIGLHSSMQTVRAIMWRDGNKTISRRISTIE